MVFNMFFGMLLNNFKKKGGDNMITYSTLFEFCKLIVAIISLIFQIFNHKKQPNRVILFYFIK